jgi:type II secretory pathway pseudopilin PulG
VRARLTAPGTPARLASELIEAQGGFMLLEVVISALLVGLIAVATFAGFDSAGRIRGDERSHAQATVLVQQDEERLRGLTTTQLAQLGTAEPHYEAENGMCLEKISSTIWHYYSKENTSFCEKASLAGTTYSGIVFTVTSSAEFVTAATGKLTCEVSAGTADYIRTKSSVTWPSLGSRPPVTQSSVVSTPSSGGLLVKIENQDKEPVEGANVTAEGTALSATETTSAAGCAIFGALKAQTDKISVVKSNYVDVNGTNPPKSKESKVSAGTLGTQSFKIAAPGSITATFESNKVSGPTVKGVSFVAAQAEIETAPKYFVTETGGTLEEALTVTNLFPFAHLVEGTWKPEPYTVYAGDCKANEPSAVGATNKTVLVEPSVASPVKVEVPAVNVTVWEGTKGTPTLKHPTVTAMIINTECKGATPPVRAAKAAAYEHTVNVSTTTGNIEAPYLYQPYAKKLQFCAVAKIGATYYKYETPVGTPIENKEAKGTTVLSVYIKEPETTAGYTHKATEKCP